MADTKNKGGRSGFSAPQFGSPQPGFEQPDSEIYKERIRKAEGQIAQAVSAGLAFWFGSLKFYEGLINEWTRARQDALLKSMKAIQEISSDQTSERKSEQTADVLFDQWTSFQRDLLSVQMKTVAQVGALYGNVQPPKDLDDLAKMPAQLVESMQQAAASSLKK